MEINTILLLSMIFAASSYLVMINVIYYLAPTVKHEIFPKKSFGKNNCTRVAENPNRGRNMEPIITDVSNDIIKTKIKDIISKMQRIKIINETKDFIHFVQITPFFRFYDDIFIRIFVNKGKTNVWFQSQSRLGLYDFQINEKRIELIYNELKKLL
tara:strand:- start:1450 stop:1917 length:468 start_codon:yes stop_codon:yes gene_type:complete